MNHIAIAEQMMYNLHEGQMYGHLPYSEHCLLVARVAEEICQAIPYGNISDVVCTAFLHDVMEDCPWLECPNTAAAMLESIFGSNVSRALDKLNRHQYNSYHFYMNAVATINPEYESSIIAAIVKLADSLVNEDMCIVTKSDKRAKKYTANVAQLLKAIEGWRGVDLGPPTISIVATHCRPLLTQ